MDGEPATEIKFLHLSSRIARLRYFAYTTLASFVSLPVYAIGVLLIFRGMHLSGMLLTLAGYIFFIPIQFTFIIRRLHDIGRSGWWSLIYGTLIPFGLIGIFHRITGPVMSLYLLLILVNLGFILMLLFKPGTSGDNHYGSPPPPNNAWVIAGAWSALFIPIFGIVLAFIVGARVSNAIARTQAAHAVQLARRAEEQARLYYQDKKTWPTDFRDVGGENLTRNTQDTISTIKYPDGSYGIIVTSSHNSIGNSFGERAVEVWTGDGGETWHCGPAYASTASRDLLPESCQEDSPPIP